VVTWLQGNYTGTTHAYDRMIVTISESAIHFNHQSSFLAVETNHEVVNNLLAPEVIIL
jgi:hypothetical protein